MLMILKLLLLFAISVIAVLGDVREGPKPLYKRITGRGWFTIAFLVGVLIIEVTTDRLDERENRAEKAAADRRESDLKEKLRVIKDGQDSAGEASEKGHRITHESLAKLLARADDAKVTSDSASSSPEVTEIVDNISVVAARQAPVVPVRHSQQTQIQGTVSNAKEEPVGNVDIRVMDQSGRIIGAVRSDQAGQYSVRVFSDDGPLSVVYSDPDSHAELVRGLATNTDHELDVKLRRRGGGAKILGGGFL